MSSTHILPTAGAVRRQPIARKSATARRRHIRQGVWLAAIGIALALLFVWARIQVIQLGYEVSRLRKETRELAEQRNKLAATVAELKNPERLARIGRERFGMRLPRGDEIVFVGARQEAKTPPVVPPAGVP